MPYPSSSSPSEPNQPIGMAIEQSFTPDTSDTALTAAVVRMPSKNKTKSVPKREDLKNVKPPRQGGFVFNGRDGARIQLVETRGGLNALRIFAQIRQSHAQLGPLKPLYINQRFFDQILVD